MNTKLLISMIVMMFVLVVNASAYTVSGTVIGSGSGALNGAAVTVYDFTTSAVIDSTLTDASGNYNLTVPDVAAAYKFDASATGFNIAAKSTLVAADKTLNFILGPATSYTLSGTELGSQSGVTIRLKNGATTVYETTTDVTGAYSLKVTNGTYTFEASKATFTTNTSTITIAGANIAGYNFRLTTAPTTGTVSGTVRDASGNPLQNAIVRLQLSTGTVAQDTTDGTGAYLIAYNQGIYSMTASDSGFNAQTQPAVAINIGQTTTLNFNLNAPATTCTQTEVSSTSWGVCGSNGRQSRSVTYDNYNNVCGDTQTVGETRTCSTTSSGGRHGGGGGTYTTASDQSLLVANHVYVWDLAKEGNTYTKTMRAIDSIQFVYEKTSYTIYVDKLREDGTIGFRVSPTEEIKSGFKGDELIFTIKDKTMVMNIQDVVYNKEIDSQSTVKLKILLKDSGQKSAIAKIPEQVKDGVIKVIGEIAPPADASIPVGIGVSAATFVVGLLLFLGVRKIWN